MKNDKKREGEHRFEHRNIKITVDISLAKKRFSIPKLYIPKRNGKPDMSPGARWYVYFYWRSDPEGILDRRFAFYKGINLLRSVDERKAAGKQLAEAYHEVLKKGWNPETKKTERKKKIERHQLMLGEALDYAFQIKAKTKKGSTLIGYEFHKNRFQEWAKKNGYYGMDPREFTIDDYYEFHDWLRFEYLKDDESPLSGTSVNNHRSSLSALFTTMKNERIIPTNFIRGIPDEDSEVVNNKAFTLEELGRIREECLKSDAYLIYFMAFMLYPLLRPREICRIRIQDLDLKKGFLTVETKTDVLSVRRIISKMKPTIAAMNLEGVPGSYHLFSHMDQPSEWDAQLKTKVDHFGKRFNKIKTKLGFGREYTLYSVRHTAIMNLYDSLVGEGMGEQEILFNLMPITQHKSVAGIKAYLRRHRKSIPPDHSDIYTLDF